MHIEAHFSRFTRGRHWHRRLADSLGTNASEMNHIVEIEKLAVCSYNSARDFCWFVPVHSSDNDQLRRVLSPNEHLDFEVDARVPYVEGTDVEVIAVSALGKIDQEKLCTDVGYWMMRASPLN